ncbi:hypothetical protein Q8A67_021836 [Cirrhinus molitorella]|uniref:Heat shock factor binding protein 1 n=1 Tax=Cirrhinus molitorella TaxID=172907 RepID=A0AA88P6G9_9TELE|nr:hypothetical protein Q8A67_021836 [Cirrhinus molitorella]
MATTDPTAGLGLEGKDMSLIMEKISDKIISAFDERFDKLEATLRAIQTTQRELIERVETFLASSFIRLPEMSDNELSSSDNEQDAPPRSTHSKAPTPAQVKFRLPSCTKMQQAISKPGPWPGFGCSSHCIASLLISTSHRGAVSRSATRNIAR